MSDRDIPQIRIATPDDSHDLGAMHVASWRETYTGLLPDKILSALSVEARTAAWDKIMRESTTERSTVVYGEFQKRKIGTHLFRAMTSDLISRGFNAAALWVLRDNLKARRFYEHFGAKVIAEREDVRDGAVLVELPTGGRRLRN